MSTKPEGALYVDKLFKRKVYHNIFYIPDTDTLIYKSPGKYREVSSGTIPVKYLTTRTIEDTKVEDIKEYLRRNYKKNCSETNTRKQTFTQYVQSKSSLVHELFV